MKLRVRALAVAAAAVSITGFTAMTANAAARPADTVSPTAQLVFDDYLTTVNSIQIIGVNQNGTKEYACWTTPQTVNLIPGWWWSANTIIWPYTSNNCTPGTEVGSSPLILNGSPTNPPYHCQEDVSPFNDWNPGSTWQNCAVAGKKSYGSTTGNYVWSHT